MNRRRNKRERDRERYILKEKERKRERERKKKRERENNYQAHVLDLKKSVIVVYFDNLKVAAQSVCRLKYALSPFFLF